MDLKIGDNFSVSDMIMGSLTKKGKTKASDNVFDINVKTSIPNGSVTSDGDLLKRHMKTNSQDQQIDSELKEFIYMLIHEKLSQFHNKAVNATVFNDKMAEGLKIKDMHLQKHSSIHDMSRFNGLKKNHPNQSEFLKVEIDRITNVVTSSLNSILEKILPQLEGAVSKYGLILQERLKESLTDKVINKGSVDDIEQVSDRMIHEVTDGFVKEFFNLVYPLLQTSTSQNEFNGTQTKKDFFTVLVIPRDAAQQFEEKGKSSLDLFGEQKSENSTTNDGDRIKLKADQSSFSKNLLDVKMQNDNSSLDVHIGKHLNSVNGKQDTPTLNITDVKDMLKTQLNESFDARISDGSKISVRFTLESFGNLELSLTKDAKEDTYKLKVMVDSHFIKQKIEDSVAEIKEDMKQKGIAIKVDIEEKQTDEENRESNDHHKNENRQLTPKNNNSDGQFQEFLFSHLEG